MRWTRELRLTCAAQAYGEVVWFGRRGAGAKLAIRSAGDGGKRAVLRGEHEVSRKAIARGRPECFALPCMLVCSLVSANRTRDRGCSKHPVFPAPSVFEEGKRDANLGRNAPRARSHTLYRDCLHAGRPCERRDPYAAADVVLPRRSTTFVQQW